MKIFSALLDRFILVALIIAAGAVPSFIQQYRQQVNGRLEQAIADLQPFVVIANQRHDGDVRALIAHHLGSSDPTFVREGQAIDDMVVAVQQLNGANNALDAPLWSQAAYLLQHVRGDVATATWNLFRPAFELTTQGLVFAVVVGVCVWLLVLGIARLVMATWRALTLSRNAAR